MAIKKTRFGDVDTHVFDEFCDSFSLGCMRDAIDQLEAVGFQISSMREDLRRLYNMANKLIEEERYVRPPDQKQCKEGDEIWALAEDLSMYMTDWPEQIDAVQDLLDQIARLGPDPDDEDYLG